MWCKWRIRWRYLQFHTHYLDFLASGKFKIDHKDSWFITTWINSASRIYPLMLELAVEVTYPLPESIVTALVGVTSSIQGVLTIQMVTPLQRTVANLDSVKTFNRHKPTNKNEKFNCTCSRPFHLVKIWWLRAFKTILTTFTSWMDMESYLQSLGFSSSLTLGEVKWTKNL